jgi:hypothetical protein
MKTGHLLYWLAAALLGRDAVAFTASPATGVRPLRYPLLVRMGGSIFDDLAKLFNRREDNGNENKPDSIYRVATIPVESIKPGALRLFMMFFFLGMQNTPEKGSWKANQPSTEEFLVDFYFHDNSAILSVEMKPNEITIDRVGPAPSTAYMMQEAVIVQGVLDELHRCAFDVEVKEEHRLLILPEPKDAIEKARDQLAYG